MQIQTQYNSQLYYTYPAPIDNFVTYQDSHFITNTLDLYNYYIYPLQTYIQTSPTISRPKQIIPIIHPKTLKRVNYHNTKDIGIQNQNNGIDANTQTKYINYKSNSSQTATNEESVVVCTASPSRIPTRISIPNENKKDKTNLEKEKLLKKKSNFMTKNIYIFFIKCTDYVNLMSYF